MSFHELPLNFRMCGLVETRALLSAMLRDDDYDIAALAARPLVVPDAITALRLIDVLRETGEHFAVVVDGGGNIDGVVTTTDIFAAIAGDIAEDEDDSAIERIDEATLEVEAKVTLLELAEALGREEIAAAGRYTSLAGFLLFELGRIPDEGETIERGGLAFTIKSSKPSRIERVLVHDLQITQA